MKELLGPELKFNRVKAKCPMCGKLHSKKLSEKGHYYSYTGNLQIPYINCIDCLVSMRKKEFSGTGAGSYGREEYIKVTDREKT